MKKEKAERIHRILNWVRFVILVLFFAFVFIGLSQAKRDRYIPCNVTWYQSPEYAVDIRVLGMEQLLRYAVILLDISDESQEPFDELLIERNARGSYWLHFAVRPEGNRRKIRVLQVER